MDPDPLFVDASVWESLSESKRFKLRSVIEHLVGYPCSLKCSEQEPAIRIAVSAATDPESVRDWLELWIDGAIYVVFSEYSPARQSWADELQEACERYSNATDILCLPLSDSD